MESDKTDHELNREGEDLLIVIQVAALAVSLDSQLGQTPYPRTAHILWDDHVSVYLKQSHPQREFDRTLFLGVIEDALQFAREFQERHSKC